MDSTELFYNFNRRDYFRIFRGWVRNFVIPFYLAFGALDYFYSNENFLLWTSTRLVVALTWWYVPCLFRYLWVRRNYQIISIFAMSLAPLSVSLMVLTSGDQDQSPYIFGVLLCYAVIKNIFVLKLRLDLILASLTFAPIFALCLYEQNYILLAMLLGYALTSMFSGAYRLAEKGMAMHYENDLEKRVHQLSQSLKQEYQAKVDLIQKTASSQAIAHATAKIAHDLKAPFHTLKVVLNQLDNQNPQKIKKLLPILQQATQYVDHLSNNLMLDPNGQIKIEAASAQKMTLFAWNQVQLLDEKIPFETKIPQDLQLDVQKIAVERLFINLLKNAIEASDTDDSLIWVHISPMKDHKRAQITVGNRGSIIPQERLERLLIEFKSIGKQRGIGLGLSIVCQVVKAHQGQIRCESDSQGTRFIFDLPLA